MGPCTQKARAAAENQKCPVNRKKDGCAMSFTRESERVRSQRREAVLTRQVLCGKAVLEVGGLASARAWDSSAEGILGVGSSCAELESVGGIVY